MSVIRRNNSLGQMRWDVADARALDSGIAHDFDVLAGKMMGGRQALVVRGLTIATAGTYGAPPTGLQLSTAGALVMHYGATEAGTLLEVPDDQTVETLDGSNPRLIGGFASNAINYVGLDFIRQADDTTSDQTKFLTANTETEITKSVAKGVVLDYRIIVTTSPFSLTTNVCPVAIVVTDSNGNVASITDARQGMFRLGRGGDVPSADAGYSWPDAGRRENPVTYTTGGVDPFIGGDKGIGSMKAWMDAVMHTLWEAKSGESWYSQTSRDNMKLAMAPAPSSLLSGDNFSWNSGTNTLSWVNLSILFENSSGGYYNPITDGSAVLTANGKCVYADINRKSTAAIVLTAGDLQSLPAPTIPGSRIIVAWRYGDEIYVRDRHYQVGRQFAVATAVTTPGGTTGGTLGVVKLSHTAVTPSAPIVLSDGARDAAFGVVALSSTKSATIVPTSGTALTVTAPVAANGVVITGGGTTNRAMVIQTVSANATSLLEVINNYASGSALTATGGAGTGIEATGATGVHGFSGAGIGVWGHTNGGTGVYGQSDAAGGVGVEGVATAGNSIGIRGTGHGNLAGVRGIGGGSAGNGVEGQGGAGGGNGVVGTGSGNGDGIQGIGSGASSTSFGVFADGQGTAAGISVTGIGNGAASGDDAMRVFQNINMLGSLPASTVGFTNKITPLSFFKSWGVVTGAGSSAGTVNDGTNIASVTAPNATLIRVNFATAMANATYAVTHNYSGGSTGVISVVNAKNANYVEFYFLQANTNAVISDTTGHIVDFHIASRQ